MVDAKCSDITYYSMGCCRKPIRIEYFSGLYSRSPLRLSNCVSSQSNLIGSQQTCNATWLVEFTKTKPDWHPPPFRSKILIKNTQVSCLDFWEVHYLRLLKSKKWKKSVGPKIFYGPSKIGHFLSILHFLYKKGVKK